MPPQESQVNNPQETELSPEEAKASLGIATYLQEGLLDQIGMENQAMGASMGGQEPQGTGENMEPQEDTNQKIEELKNDFNAKLKEVEKSTREIIKEELSSLKEAVLEDESES